MSKPNVGILTTKDWVTSLINKVIKRRDSDIKIYSNTASNISCVKDTSTKLLSLNLPKGTYVVTSSFIIESTDIRYFFSLVDVSTSAYDSDGYVAGNLSTVVEVPDDGLTIDAMLYVSGKSITVDKAKIKAVKLK